MKTPTISLSRTYNFLAAAWREPRQIRGPITQSLSAINEAFWGTDKSRIVSRYQIRPAKIFKGDMKMKIISCGNCGILIDTDRLTLINIVGEDGAFISAAIWNPVSADYEPPLCCPACKETISSISGDVV